MPVTPTYPGVYVEEISSGVHTIIGVATSITAFLGRAVCGPTNEPTTINSFGDFERQFGGLDAGCPMSYAVRDFYLNGGDRALIVRLYRPDATGGDGLARFALDNLKFAATNPGDWGSALRTTADVEVSDEMRGPLGITNDDLLFNLTVTGPNGVTESYRNLTVVDSSRRIDKVLATDSNLIQWDGDFPQQVPNLPLIKAACDARQSLLNAQNATPTVQATIDAAQAAYDAACANLDDAATKADKQLQAALAAKPQVPADITAAQKAVSDADAAMKTSNGQSLDATAYQGNQAQKTGLYALDKADLFNLLCIPPDSRDGDTDAAVYQSAMEYCAGRRAMLIVDSPAAWSENAVTAAATAKQGLPTLGLSGTYARNAALYFPRVTEADPLQEGRPDTFVPCGIIAGIMASTDMARGVWKAPAGLDASLNGIAGLEVNLTDAENGMLNPLAINCLRFFPAAGQVVWGARTLRGSDQLADDYKYIPVRRLALYIEESLYRGTQWVVFEPNDEPLWASIRLNVGAFMHGLYRLGAFQGQTPKDAYFVKCDSETNPQDQINQGIVNIVVGFAPLKPAEFVIIQVQQMTGQIDT